ncbi:MAG: tRNA preQ1(34) S-adenosylmethionine ribosyltransferase-isomerase QueA [Vicinamibacterales bacterium]
MRVSDFDFDLPDALIAQEPPAVRGGSRLLVLHRATGAIEHRSFSDLPEYLRAGDLLVVNDTRVFPARLLGHRTPSGGAVECLLLSRADEPATGNQQPATTNQQLPTNIQLWSCLMRAGGRLAPGARVVFERDGTRLDGEVVEPGSDPVGRRTIRLWTEQGSVSDAIERIGHIPLPPYIGRDDTSADRERYQTVFAHHRGFSAGSIAAPTAGLHFTEPMLDALKAKGVEMTNVTLHVGYGTFKPVRVSDVEQHEVDPERYDASQATVDALSRARREGRRIIAVGTTTTRVLESLTVSPDGGVHPSTGETRTFIYPGHRFQLVDALVTNFHLPRSSLLMLVAARGGREQVLAAYREAVERGYRFYSYGDAMLVD